MNWQNENNFWILPLHWTIEWILKEGEKIDIYLDLVRELKKLYNMKMMKIVLEILGIVLKETNWAVEEEPKPLGSLHC